MVEATGFEPTTFASRTRRATSCATPRFFSFLSIFVSGQTCGQATYFERFVEKCTARIVRFFKGFSDFQKSLLQDRWRCPEYDSLPIMRPFNLPFIFLRNAYIIAKMWQKVKSFFPLCKTIFYFCKNPTTRRKKKLKIIKNNTVFLKNTLDFLR